MKILILALKNVNVGASALASIFGAFFIIFSGSPASAQDLAFGTDNITVGNCEMQVYVADDPYQKASGMLGFTDSTFLLDGMVFISAGKAKTHYYHTVGMKMDIMIMGLLKTGDNTYKLAGQPIKAPAGIDMIKVFGLEVLEIPMKKYDETFKGCLNVKGIDK